MRLNLLPRMRTSFSLMFRINSIQLSTNRTKGSVCLVSFDVSKFPAQKINEVSCVVKITQFKHGIYMIA